MGKRTKSRRRAKSRRSTVHGRKPIGLGLTSAAEIIMSLVMRG